MRRRPRLELLLAAAAGVVVLLCAGRAPVVDEEVYLFLAARLAEDPLHPYAFSRAMQPWGGGAETFLFAHPPLHWAWIAGWRAIAGDAWVPLLRVLTALPPALLLGWATARLARRTARHPGLAALAWLASPVTLLALAAGLMNDLGATALATAGVVAWREAFEGDDSRTRLHWLVGAGVLLGLAAATKYPMLVLAFVVFLHAIRTKRLPWSWPLWAAMLATWGAVELWIGVAHGGFHLGAVLLHASEIARGPLSGRILGVLVRAGLALAPLLVLQSARPALTGACVMAAVALTWALPPELSTLQTTVLATMALFGALWFMHGLAALRPRGKDKRHDDFLLGLWVVAVLLAVALGHNFASGRYLLPAMAPLACLAARRLASMRLCLHVAPALIGAWGVLSVAMVVADARYANALEDLAVQVTERHEPGWFTGEWAFRHTLERAGWRYAKPAERGGDLPAGAIVVTPTHAGAGPLPWGRLEEIEVLPSDDHFPLRITDVTGRVGWYGETLGALPVGWRSAPLEEVTAYRVLR